MRVPSQAAGVKRRPTGIAGDGQILPAQSVADAAGVARPSPAYWFGGCIPNCVCVRQEGCPCCGYGDWPIVWSPWG